MAVTLLGRQTLGLSDLEVSPFCLGTNQYGTTLDQVAAETLMDRFVAMGGNFIDTARCYGDWVEGAPCGASERAIGTWLTRQERSSIIIATKGGIADIIAGDNRPRVTVEDITCDLHESLDHLKTDRIDLYYVHTDDLSQPVAPLVDMLIDFKNSGLIRHYALSNWTPARIAEAVTYAHSVGDAGPIAIEPFWGLAEPNADVTAEIGYGGHYETGFRELHGPELPMVAYSAQSKGFFTKLATGEENLPERLRLLFLNERNRSRLPVLQELAGKHQASINQIALAYLLNQPQQTIPLIGPRTLGQLEESVQAITIKLSDDEVERLRL